ncbi:FecR family protein [Sphingobacterium rhinopitheci]|uniref:FecR family protein n=1 Tax=Sphingobacterium rhinopitheci TaxID=2781960 RepID=UPI001F52503D|nr:FecR family protein [Sphingobacterium rhinopitheci]MCI0922669.1 FecR family protein [Sphingobacterium rhinopitheci]
MKNQLFESLLAKIANGTATDEELLLYHKWYQNQLQEPMDAVELNEAKSGVSKSIYDKLTILLQDEDDDLLKPQLGKMRSPRLLYSWMAAAIVLIVTGSVFYYFKNQTAVDLMQKQYDHAANVDHDAVILTLEDGTQVDISNTSEGELQNLTKLNVEKADNKLEYNHENLSSKNVTPVYNSLYTPSGKTFQLTLSDGTKVWLNAKSMLRYPTQFIENNRKVQLIGEGYFEVNSNPSKPFIVESLGQELEVLGTKFNISAYSDMSEVHSTLLEGKVSITNTRTQQSIKLNPGEQTVLSESSFKKQKVSLRNVIGWKSGYFVFQNEKLEDICRILTRWYNVEFDVTKNTKVLNQVYSGTMVKFNDIEDVLNVLSETGSLRYKREGGRIVFMN